MKRFLKYTLLFCAPIIVLLVVLEITLHSIPNSYSFKYNYIKEHGKYLKAIAIGHSQFYDDFKSSSFFLPSFNLSNSAQGYMEDYYLLRDLLSDMPNLKMVILPIGYMTVGREEEFTQKSCYYHEYMKVDYDGKLPLSNRYECFYVRSSIKKILSYYLLHEDITRCDSLGWSPQYISSRKYELGHDNLMDTYTLSEGASMFLAGEGYLLKILDVLKERGVTPVLVSPPYYWQCYNKTNWKQKKWAQDYITNLCKSNPEIIYIDLEDNDMFDDEDFIDESHLSEVGAEKFTQQLNIYLESL